MLNLKQKLTSLSGMLATWAVCIILAATCAGLALTAAPQAALAKSYSEVSTTYVRDHYGLLSSSDLQTFENQAANLSSTYNCAVYLVIVDNIGNSSVRSYAESYFNNYQLGSGTNRDGILFLIAVDSRKYVTITHGQGSTGGITMFTDYRIDQMESDIKDKLSDDEWVEGCQVYLNDVESTMSFYRENGEPWDEDNDPDSAKILFLIKIAATLIIALIFAGGICGMWAAQMKTAREKTEADDYFKQGSLVLTRKKDQFLHTSRSVVKIESDEHHGGGGSSVSSSGFGGSSGGSF